jgi:anti-anti-sigma regulatory factor
METAMIRIMTADEAGNTTITVDGTLSGEDVEHVKAWCTEALSNGRPVRLYLRDVSAIDEGGRRMLQHLAAAGVGLMAKGVYSAYIVDEIQSARLNRQRPAW